MRFALLVALFVSAACHTCPAPNDGTTVVPATASDTSETRELVLSAERFAVETCQCTHADCAENAHREFASWLRANPARAGSGVAAKQVAAAMEKMMLCRDKLVAPPEPIDLDQPHSASN